VNELARSLALIVVSTTLCAAPARAADPDSDVSEAKDLTAVIALQGMPCGEVVSATKRGENDYLATCKDGNRYRVFQDADGRVIVEKK
jgi:hypothetical protein